MAGSSHPPRRADRDTVDTERDTTAGPRPAVDEAAVVLDRRRSSSGELCLRRRGPHHEIISNGVFLMSTENGASERALVDEAVRRCTRPGRMLIGGLGIGFSLAQACAHRQVGHITVVELEAAIVEWHQRFFAAPLDTPMDDPRVEVVRADLGDWLGSAPTAFDAICLDVDNAPDWTVRPGNDRLYAPGGLDELARALSPAGVLAVWSAHRHGGFRHRLGERFDDVDVVEVPVDRGPADVIYLARDPRPDR